MGLSDIKKVFLDIAAHTQEVCLHLLGEPTAHPEFEEILDIAFEHNVKINLTTNGLLVRKWESVFFHSKSIRQINFSLQSYMDNFPGKPIDKYFETILDFTKELFERREDIYVNYRLWNIGSDRSNEKVFTQLEKYFDIQVSRGVQVENKKSKRVWKKLYLHFDSRFEWPSLNSKELGTIGRCHGLKSHIGILADGSVVPCCLDKEAIIKLGSIHAEKLGTILNSDLAINMKKGFNNNQLVHDLCKRCEYIRRFDKGKNVPS